MNSTETNKSVFLSVGCSTPGVIEKRYKDKSLSEPYSSPQMIQDHISVYIYQIGQNTQKCFSLLNIRHIGRVIT